MAPTHIQYQDEFTVVPALGSLCLFTLNHVSCSMTCRQPTLQSRMIVYIPFITEFLYIRYEETFFNTSNIQGRKLREKLHLSRWRVGSWTAKMNCLPTPRETAKKDAGMWVASTFLNKSSHLSLWVHLQQEGIALLPRFSLEAGEPGRCPGRGRGSRGDPH
jgi:hypothetical protein